MDKKPNRTDLLTAGRKKLQQYRQKKDNKGKDGKGKDGKSSSRSANKADKSEYADENLNSVADTTKAESSQVPGAEVESSVHSLDSTIDTQKPLENSEGTPADSQNDVDSPDFVSVETASNHELVLNTQDGCEVQIKSNEVEGSGTSGYTESNTVHVDVLAPSSDDSAPGAASDAEMAAAGSVEVKGLLEGDQDAEEFDLKHSDRTVELVQEKDEFLQASIVVKEKLITPYPEEELGISTAAISGFRGDHKTVEVSVPVETISMYANPKELDSLDLQSAGAPTYFESKENQTHFDQIAVEGCIETSSVEGSGVIDAKSHKEVVANSLGDFPEEPSLCSGVQGNLLNLVQLAEVLKQIPEGDFRYLIKSREIADHDNIVVSKNEIVALSETILE